MERIELQITRSGIKLTLNEFRPGRRIIAVGDGFDLSFQAFQRQSRAGDVLGDGKNNVGRVKEGTYGVTYHSRGGALPARLGPQARLRQTTRDNGYGI